MPAQPLRLAIIIGSTRRGRFGPTVATWFAGIAAQHESFEVDVIDLVEADLPHQFKDFSEQAPDEVAAFAPRLALADAFVVVTPEYNHSFPGSLKDAIDWYSLEWQAKPVGLVSYGGLAGGLRAVEHLRQVFAEVHAVTMRDTVSFHSAYECFGTDGAPVDPESCGQAAKTLLDQLRWWALALRTARDERPYGA